MEAKTKKILFITCGTLAGLAVLSCIGITVFFMVYGERMVEGGLNLLAGTLEEAIVTDLPEGVDEEQVRQLFRAAWGDVISRLMDQDINQRQFDQLMNQDFQKAMADEKINPDEFDYLVDRVNTVVYGSSKDPEKLEQLKRFYRQAKEDDQLNADEVNGLVGRINEVLTSPES